MDVTQKCCKLLWGYTSSSISPDEIKQSQEEGCDLQGTAREEKMNLSKILLTADRFLHIEYYKMQCWKV